MLGVIFITRSSMGFMFQSVASVAPLMVQEFRLTYGQIGVLMGLFLFPGTLIALPGGALGRRFSSQRIALTGLALMVLGALVIARSESFPMACLGRLLSGTGGIFLNLFLAKMVADWFTGKEIATAMGVMLTSWPVGIGLALVTLGRLASASSWRLGMLITAAVAAIAFVLLAALYRDPAGLARRARGPDRITLAMPGREWALSLAAGVAWALFNAGFIVLVSFGPAFLVTRGASIGQAGFLVSLGIWTSIVSVPAGGLLADRLGKPNLVITAGCLVTAVFIVLVAVLPGPALWLVLAGLAVGAAPGALMALLPRALAPQHVSTGLGVLYSVFYLVTAFAQPLAGLARDLSGSAAMPVFFAAAVTAMTTVALPVFDRLVRGRSAAPAVMPS